MARFGDLLVLVWVFILDSGRDLSGAPGADLDFSHFETFVSLLFSGFVVCSFGFVFLLVLVFWVYFSDFSDFSNFNFLGPLVLGVDVEPSVGVIGRVGVARSEIGGVFG